MPRSTNKKKRSRIEFEYTGHETVPKGVTHVRFSNVREVPVMNIATLDRLIMGMHFLVAQN